MAAMRRACCADVARSLGGGDKPHTYGWILNTLVRVEANHKYRPSLHNQPACTASAPRPRPTTTQLAIPKRQYDRGRAPLRTIEVKRWIVCLQLGRCPSKGAAGHDNELRKFCRALCFGQSPVKSTLCAKSPAKK